MTYKTPQPPVEAFSDLAQQNLVRRVYERLDNLETVTQSQSFGASGRLAPAPAKAGFSVTTNSAVKGHAYVRVINPEFLTGKQNQARVAIRHHLRASQTPGFTQGIVDFPVSHQTYYDISELGSGTWYLQLRSTTDGQTFNSWQQQKVTIP